MIRVSVRVASVLVLLLLMCLTDAYVRQQDEVVPLGSDASWSMDFSESSLSKTEAVAALDEISAAHDLRLLKVGADRGDFFHGTDLYRFGGGPQAPDEIRWYDKSRHGTARPSSQLGDADLSGTYAFRASLDGRDALARFTSEHGVAVRESAVDPAHLLLVTVWSSGFGVSVVSAAVLLLVALTGQSVLAAHSKAVRVAAGQSAPSIIGSECLGTLRSILPYLLGSLVLAAGAVAVLRGPGQLPRFLSAALPALGVLAVLVLVAFLVVSLVGWPSAALIARRTSRIGSFRYLSEPLKVVALLATAVTLPLLASSALTSLGASTRASYWETFSDDVTLRILTPSEDAYLAAQPRLAELARGADERGELLLSYLAPQDAHLVDGSRFDGLVLANSAYLDQVARQRGVRYSPVASDDVAAALSPGFTESFDLWCAQNCEVADLEAVTVSGGGPLPVVDASAGTPELELLEHPLVVTTDHAAERYREDFIGPLLTSGNLMVASGATAEDLVDGNGLRTTVLSIDRVADAGLLQGQVSQHRAVAQLTGLVLVLAALALTAAVSAHVHVATVQRQLFLRHSAGQTWGQVLGTRMLYDAVLACGCSLVAFVYCLTQNVDLAAAAFLAPVLYLAISAPALRRSARSSFVHSISRKA